MRLKSWESPRSGRRRNHKSKQASARLRQLKKRNQQLRNRLKALDQTGAVFLSAAATSLGLMG